MKTSQLAMLSALGVIVLFTVGTAVSLRFSQPANGAEVSEFSGERTTRAHDATGFTGIDASGEWEISVTQGDAWQVELSYPTELEDSLNLRVVNGRFILDYNLRRGWRDRVRLRDELRVTARITMPALERAQLSGASLLTFSGFTGDELEIESSGASRIEGMDSRYAELELDMSGAGAADLRGVVTTTARVDISGAPNATLQMAGGDLSGSMSGAGSLVYYGTTRSQSISTSGAARVRQRE